MPVGMMFILAFGWIEVLHSPSLLAWLASMLSSTGLKGSTTQDGLATAEKSVLVAIDIQLSSLQEPTSEMSAASTMNAPLAARTSSAIGSIAVDINAANAMRPAQSPIPES